MTPTPTPSDPEPECTENSDCDDGQICNDDGECGDCSNDDDCDDNETCTDGRCRDSCMNGSRYAYYKLENNGDDTENSAPGRIPDNSQEGSDEWRDEYLNVGTVLRDQDPTATGTSKSLGVDTQCEGDETTDVYGDEYDGDTLSTIVQNIGYFHLSKSGTYTFRLTNADEAIFLWTGDKAKEGWTQGNADAKAAYVRGSSEDGSFEVDATAGEYIPYRILWANSVGCGGFQVQVNDPDGETIIGRGQDNDDGQFGYMCGDNLDAPDFDF